MIGIWPPENQRLTAGRFRLDRLEIERDFHWPFMMVTECLTIRFSRVSFSKVSQVFLQDSKTILWHLYHLVVGVLLAR